MHYNIKCARCGSSIFAKWKGEIQLCIPCWIELGWVNKNGKWIREQIKIIKLNPLSEQEQLNIRQKHMNATDEEIDLQWAENTTK